MDASGPAAFNGAESDLTAAFAGVATNPAKHQPNQLGDAQSAAFAQLAGSLALAAASLAAGPVQANSVVAEMHTRDGGQVPLASDVLRSLPSMERRASMEQPSRRMHSELLPPARLVEVAHAALQSSGFRRRQQSGQQPSQQDNQLKPERSIGQSAEATLAKRERQPEEKESNGDLKRPRVESTGGHGEQDNSVPSPLATGGADGVARIAPVGPPAAISQQALQPAVASLPGPAPPIVSPFARPASAVVASTDAAATTAGTNGPLKSAFQSVAFATEWQPGCSVTTGRRSARSPAPKGSRNLSIPRASSMDATSSPMSRRGSGFAAAAAATAAAATAAAATAAAATVSSAAPVPVPATAPEAATGSSPNAVAATASIASAAAAPAPVAAPAAEPGNEGAAAAAAVAGVNMETAASADLRRLAQLAEAAAMLEGEFTTQAGASKGGARAGAGGAASRSQEEGARGPSGAGPAAEGPVAPLRQRAGSLTTGGLPPAGPSATLSAGSGSAVNCGLAAAAGQPHLGSGSAAGGPLKAANGSVPLPGRFGDPHAANGSAGAGPRGRGGAREGSPDGGPEEDRAGSPHRRGGHDSGDAMSGGGSRENGRRGRYLGDDDEDCDGDGDGDDGGDGSNDSGVGGSSAGAGGGSGMRSLTERYRAALKASAAQQRGRGGAGSGGRRDADSSSRASIRNGVCARIASITKERLQQVYHLNIEEAARELGIGMTKLKEHCRTLGIPRWPSRKLKSMDKLIESLNERAMTEPATKEVIADILAEIEQFKRAIYENPCLEVEEDIKRLRQSNFKKEYQQRQVEQRMRMGSSDRPSASGGASGLAAAGRASSLGAPLPHGGPGGGLREVTSGALSAASMAALAGMGPAGPGAALAAAGLGPALAAGLGPALVSGQLPGGSALVPGQLPGGAAAAAAAAGMLNQAQLAQALSQAQGQVPLLAPGLQQLLLGQQPGMLHDSLQRAFGTLPPPSGLLLPPMLNAQPPAQQLQQVFSGQPNGRTLMEVAAAAAAGPVLEEKEQ